MKNIKSRKALKISVLIALLVAVFIIAKPLVEADTSTPEVEVDPSTPEVIGADPSTPEVMEASTNGLTYTEVDGELTVAAYDATLNTSHPNLVIPAQDNGKPVTAIANMVFQSKGLQSVVIPDSITIIPSGAFRYCDLRSVVLPKQLVSIEMGAFTKNPNLTSITIPNTVTSIKDNAFAECGLTSVILPPNLTTLGARAFWKNKITSIVIPGTVGTNGGTWGDGSFNDNLLQSVVINEGVTAIPSDFTFDGTKPDYEYTIHSLTLPSTLKSVGDYAFYLASLSYVNLPSSVTSVGKDAFIVMNARLPYVKKLDDKIHYKLPDGMDMTKLSLNSYGADIKDWSIDVEKREIVGPQNALSLPGYTYVIGTINGIPRSTNISIGISGSDIKGEIEVRFSDYDGRVIKEKTVPMYTDLRNEVPEVSREGYLFTGWQGDTFLESLYFAYDFKATYVACPIITASDQTINGGSTFDPLRGVSAKGGVKGNDLTSVIRVIENNVDVSKEGTYTVVLEVTDKYNASGVPLTTRKEYKVTVVFERVDVRFLDYDNRVLEEARVLINGTAVATVKPTRNGYTFIGWDKSLENITTSTDFIAQYKALPKVTTQDITIKVGDVFTPLDHIKAIDADGKDIKIDTSMITNNPVDTTTVGNYTVAYAIQDSWGGKVIGSFTVTVEPIMEHKILTNTNTNITIEGIFEKDGQLIIELIPTKDNVMQDKVIGKTVVGSYEAYVIGKYQGDLVLTFPVDSKYNGNAIYIYHQKQDKTIDEYKRVVKDGKVSITVTELSPFILGVDTQENVIDPNAPIGPILKPETPMNPTSPNNSQNKGTGTTNTSDTTADIAKLCTILVFVGISIIGLRRKENS